MPVLSVRQESNPHREIFRPQRYTAKKSGSQSGGSGKTAQPKPQDSKQLRDDLFETDGKPNKPLANMSIDKSGESGIIDVKKIKVEDFTEEQNNKLHEAHKNLLEQLKDKDIIKNHSFVTSLSILDKDKLREQLNKFQKRKNVC